VTSFGHLCSKTNWVFIKNLIFHAQKHKQLIDIINYMVVDTLCCNK